MVVQSNFFKCKHCQGILEGIYSLERVVPGAMTFYKPTIEFDKELCLFSPSVQTNP